MRRRPWRPVPIVSTRTCRLHALSRDLAGCSISYKSAAIATAPGGWLAYRLQVTLAVPGLHPRPLARLDGGQHMSARSKPSVPAGAHGVDGISQAADAPEREGVPRQDPADSATAEETRGERFRRKA